jgi:hypothetical protein
MPWRMIFERYDRTMNEIEDRKNRITAALSSHGVDYALVGGQAVIAWVTTVDPDAVRTTKAVDSLLRRQDLPKAKQAAAAAGFDYFEIMGVGMFLDRADPNPRRGVHLVWANEIIRPGDTVPSPPMEDSAILGQGLSVVSLEWLVKMKLTAWRRHDQVHLQDMIDVGLVDASWCGKLPHELAARLQQLIEAPGG